MWDTGQQAIVIREQKLLSTQTTTTFGSDLEIEKKSHCIISSTTKHW